MPALPAWSLNAKRLKRIAIFFLAFFAIFSIFNFQFSISNVYAQPGPPNPQPCENALNTDKLTDIYIPSSDPNDPRGAPIKVRLDRNYDPRLGNLAPGTTITIAGTARFPIDFSKLQALFATSNSNYWEGNFQSDSHRLANIIGFNGQDFNSYHGAGQKIAQKIVVDKLREKYIHYVYSNPHLIESTNTYNDINGQGQEKTIYDLVNEFSLPSLPSSNATPGEKDAWLTTWGKYWEKIPTAYREFYNGKVEFRLEKNIFHSELIRKGEDCPDTIREIIFSSPEFSRTVSIADQLNQTIVPCAAQSWQHGANNDECGTTTSSSHNILNRAINTCWEIITTSTKRFGEVFKKVIKVSLEKLNPIGLAFAQEDVPTEPERDEYAKSCIKLVGKDDKEGTAPYCAIDSSQLIFGDSCNNPYGNDPNKLNSSSNVACNFVINWSATFTARNTNDVPFDQRTKDDFDICADNGLGGLNCSVLVKIWPVIRVPFLAEIWNNTLYSDEIEGQPGRGVGSQQITGRPGIYSFFMPRAAANEVLPATYRELADRCYNQNDQSACQKIQEEIRKCLELSTSEEKAACIRNFYSQDLPGKVINAADLDPKQRFIGGTDCAKEFVRDFALNPKALQGKSITELCKSP